MQVGADGDKLLADVMMINRPDDLDDIANLGLTLTDVKRVLQASNWRLLPPKRGAIRFSNAWHQRWCISGYVGTKLGGLDVVHIYLPAGRRQSDLLDRLADADLIDRLK